ncbi:peptidase M14 [Thioclava sp. BHET1]|nr:peptidase M14 [Thioclava sp. BHET1]
MSVLLSQAVPRLLPFLEAGLISGLPGGVAEIWLFEDAASRQAAEARLARAGIAARIRSAYKPLLHWALELLPRAGLERLEVIYPRHAGADPRRFLLEAYPLAELLAPVEVIFRAGEEMSAPAYIVHTHRTGGIVEEVRVEAPNRLHPDPLGESCLSPTGWLRLWDSEGGLLRDERLETEYELICGRALEVVARHSWPSARPCFEMLSLRVDLPAEDLPLSHGVEAVSLAEALHEDLYFGCLEIFQRRFGLAPGDRSLRPGQIVPEIRSGATAPFVEVALRPHDTAERAEATQPLDRAERALSAAQISAEMAALGGVPFAAATPAGRQALGVYHAGPGPAVLLSAGQHANETSGPVGILRAARVLAGRQDSHFALIGLENPDGYALHRRLCADHPQHMHHAARYSALGDDIGAREAEPLYEAGLRRAAIARSGAALHVNLHGYPAHEWTRPMAGYLPRGFEAWTLPKGAFLILRHQPGEGARARAFLDRVTAELAAWPELMAFNAAQLAIYERYAGPAGFTLVNGYSCLIVEEARALVPVTLISELPDETVEGAAFRFAHEVQMRIALASVEAWRAGATG